MSTLRIAIALPTRNAYSETFIAAHEQRLKGVVAVLSDGRPPSRVDERPLLVPVNLVQRLGSLVERRFLGLQEDQRLHRKLVGILRQRRVDVVLAEYGVMGEALVDVCNEAQVPLVAHFHGYDAHSHNVLAESNGYKRLFDSASALVVVSRAMEQQLLGLGASRSKVIYNCYGIDVERFHPGEVEATPPHFVAIGRFVDKKAPLLTLLAFRRVLDQCPGARLRMVGHGPLHEACGQLLRALHMTEQVDLLGVRTPAEVSELMRASRAFVQHSVVTSGGDSEGTPLAVLEAMASGLPVVSTRHAGINDVVAHEERGLLCAEGDVDAMACDMLRLANDASLAAHYGANGRAYVMAQHRVEDRVTVLQDILYRAAANHTRK